MITWIRKLYDRWKQWCFHRHQKHFDENDDERYDDDNDPELIKLFEELDAGKNSPLRPLEDESS